MEIFNLLAAIAGVILPSLLLTKRSFRNAAIRLQSAASPDARQRRMDRWDPATVRLRPRERL
jgi:hypothetical protein